MHNVDTVEYDVYQTFAVCDVCQKDHEAVFHGIFVGYYGEDTELHCVQHCMDLGCFDRDDIRWRQG